MKPSVRLVSGEHERRIAADSAVGLGGADSGLYWPGLATSQPTASGPVAYIAVQDGRWTLRPTGAAAVYHNGGLLDDVATLADGDVIGCESAELHVGVHGEDLELVDAADGIHEDDEAGLITPADFRPSHRRRSNWRRALRPLPIAAYALLAVLGGIAWFMLTARSVELSAEPPAEHVEVSGGLLAFELGGRYLMRPGDYTVRLTREGYHPLDETIRVTDQPNQVFGFRLRKLPGLLRVTTADVNDAQVLVDGEPLARTPTPPIELEPGMHSIAIEAPRYVAYTGEIDIEGGGAEQHLEVKLEPRWANVTVVSEPPDAELLVDGESLGRTPVEVELLEGTHELQLSRAGFKTWVDELEVARGETLALGPITLEQADGLVGIRSTPAGASVMVNGRYRGQTPLDLSLGPGRSYRLEVAKAGYQKERRQVAVVSGQSQQLSFRLEPFLGEVRIVTDPADAEVYVNGNGPQAKVLELPAVPQQIEVRRPGYAVFRTTVTPRPGFPQQVTARLKTEAQARAEAIPRRPKTILGQELILVQPGRFTMGSSRREQGRRSNESLRQVELTRMFYIGVREVTNADYRQYQADAAPQRFQGIDLGRPDHPVVGITWDQAARFCNWLSGKEGLSPAYVEQGGKMVAAESLGNGYRLPTEAEWAWAGRYAGGLHNGRFPWGEDWPPAGKVGNYADESARRLFDDYIKGYNDGYAGPAPGGSFPASPLGLFDIGGNVAEWVHDLYTIYPPSAAELQRDPTGPTDGEFRVIRGSSWQQASLSSLRLAYRDYSDSSRPDVGFRIGRYVE